MLQFMGLQRVGHDLMIEEQQQITSLRSVLFFSGRMFEFDTLYVSYV